MRQAVKIHSTFLMQRLQGTIDPYQRRILYFYTQAQDEHALIGPLVNCLP
jgi:hypothetical protein